MIAVPSYAAPAHLLLASLLFSGPAASFIPSARTMVGATARRSARLQKRSLATSKYCQPGRTTSEPHSSMKVSELRDLLRQRGLAVSGVKAILIERLASSNDASKDATTGAHPTAKRARKKRSLDIPIPNAIATTQTVDCLPRTRERQLQSRDSGSKPAVIGVDEAGRGPLAGPVVAAAAIVPTDISGIIDSKKITKEDDRERLYDELIASPGIRYAVAVVSAQRIDEINILQATLEGMRMAVEGVMNLENNRHPGKKDNVASADRNDTTYIVTGGATGPGEKHDDQSYYALIDGNRCPKNMPCPNESLTKGDGREYSIAAASILAKVTRDRLMHEYDGKYPEYNLGQHKGYPTAAHMSAVKTLGASPIHRRTFAPLKHMEFDENGKVIG
ncbi:hypothetical protein ACHAWF_016606 [Thalassiosira exigua]